MAIERRRRDYVIAIFFPPRRRRRVRWAFISEKATLTETLCDLLAAELWMWNVRRRLSDSAEARKRFSTTAAVFLFFCSSSDDDVLLNALPAGPHSTLSEEIKIVFHFLLLFWLLRWCFIPSLYNNFIFFSPLIHFYRVHLRQIVLRVLMQPTYTSEPDNKYISSRLHTLTTHPRFFLNIIDFDLSFLRFSCAKMCVGQRREREEKQPKLNVIVYENHVEAWGPPRQSLSVRQHPFFMLMCEILFRWDYTFSLSLSPLTCFCSIKHFTHSCSAL